MGTDAQLVEPKLAGYFRPGGIVMGIVGRVYYVGIMSVGKWQILDLYKLSSLSMLRPAWVIFLVSGRASGRIAVMLQISLNWEAQDVYHVK